MCDFVERALTSLLQQARGLSGPEAGLLHQVVHLTVGSDVTTAGWGIRPAGQQDAKFALAGGLG